MERLRSGKDGLIISIRMLCLCAPWRNSIAVPPVTCQSFRKTKGCCARLSMESTLVCVSQVTDMTYIYETLLGLNFSKGFLDKPAAFQVNLQRIWHLQTTGGSRNIDRSLNLFK